MDGFAEALQSDLGEQEASVETAQGGGEPSKENEREKEKEKEKDEEEKKPTS